MERKPRGYWTLELLQKEALKYETRGSFYKGSPAYKAARRVGVLEKICSHMENSSFIKWTPESLSIEALKYNTRQDFRKGSPRAADRCIDKGIMDEVCSHMVSGRRVWFKENLIIEALKYSSVVDFKRGSQAAYNAAKKLGLSDSICTHMIRGDFQSDNDALYIWNVIGTNIYKIGITSVRLGVRRIVEVANSIGAEYKILKLIEVNDATTLEKTLLSFGKPVEWGDEHFNGMSEFRHLGDADVATITSLLAV